MSQTLTQWLLIMGFGAVCGLIGQCIRTFVGLYKLSNLTPETPVDVVKILIGLLMGATAGSLASLLSVKANIVGLDQTLALIAAGYSGSDFIEAFVSKYSSVLANKRLDK